VGSWFSSSNVRIETSSNETSWDFRNGAQGWVIGNGLSNQTQEPSGLWFHVSANDPYLFGPMINASAASYPYIYLKMASQTDNCGQIYFRRETDTSFAEERHVALPIVANGGDNYLIVDMRNNANWTGTITQLRLDPACGAVNNRAVRIDQLALLSNATSWDFRNGAQGWFIGNGLSNQTQEPSGLWFHVSANDPYLFGPVINVPAANYPRLHLEMASQTDNCGQLYFRRQSDADFAEERHVALPIVADGSTNSFDIDMRSNSQWTGNIIQLRLDPACNAVNNRAVRIDRLSLNPPLSTPTPSPTPGSKYLVIVSRAKLAVIQILCPLQWLVTPFTLIPILL
jgi:uncharacterized protein (DUF736 family)